MVPQKSTLLDNANKNSHIIHGAREAILELRTLATLRARLRGRGKKGEASGKDGRRKKGRGHIQSTHTHTDIEQPG